MADKTSTIKMRFIGETRELKRKMKDLERENKRLAASVKKTTEGQSQGFGKVQKGLAKVAIAVGSVVAAYKLWQSTTEALQRRAQAQAASAGVNIDILREKTRGLITDTELMELAAALMNSQFKNSQKEINLAAEMIVVLRRQGNKLENVISGVTQALVEGNARGLRPFGVVMREASGTAETHTKILERMRQEVDGYKQSLDLAGDASLRASVQMANAWEEWKIEIGKVADELAPVIAAFALVLDTVLQVSKEVAGWANHLARLVHQFPMLEKAIGEIEEANKRARGPKLFKIGEFTKGLEEEELKNVERLPEETAQEREKRIMRVLFGGSERSVSDSARAAGKKIRQALLDATFDPIPELISGPQTLGESAPGGGVFSGLDAIMSRLEVDRDKFLAARKHAKQQSMLESIFGPTKEFKLYSELFSGLEKSIGSAFDAWITGSASVGEAFQKALAGVAKSLANEMLMQSIKHFAYAIGSLAFNDGRGAAAHAKAGSAFAAGALLAGSLAKAGGAGGTASGARAPGASPGAFGGGGGGGTPTQQVIVLASDWGDDRRTLAARVSKAMLRAEREQGAGRTVEFS